MSASVTIHPRGTAQILARQLEEMRKHAREKMREAVSVARDELRHVAPGSLGTNVDERIAGSAGEVTGVVFPHDRRVARFVDEGTGEYVEFHGPIQPSAARRAQNPRAAMKLADGVYRRRVRGQRGQHFIDRAAEHAEPRVTKILEQPAELAIRQLTG